ncbi:MAG: right-handed parallel beta-helix repeat-containing protein [Casimicrobiaceae bacterium]
MFKRYFAPPALLTLLVLGGGALDAAAAIQRTFVASYGSDANSCTLASPCRAFSFAIAQTTAGGEVVVLDSAGYGPVTIAQAVSIIAPPGIYAGVSVLTGIGVTVNPGSGKVTLRGLTINGLGGTTGIAYQSGDALYLDNVVVSGFGGGIGLNAATGAATSSLFIHDSTFRDNATGLATGTTSGTLTLKVERTIFERNTTGANVQGNTTGAIQGSSFSSGNIGLSAGFAASAKTVKLELRDCTVTDNASNGLAVGASSSPTIVSVVNTLVSGNINAGLQVTGSGNSAYVSDSAITRNGTGLAYVSSGVAVSGGDNRLINNGTDGTFSSTTLKI